MIPWWLTEFGEEEQKEVLKCFSEKRFTVSQSVGKVESLFSDILQVPYVVLANSGSSALLMAFLACGLKPEDEVIAPALTWIATAQAPALLQAKIVLCDSLPDIPIIDIKKLESLITKKTKAILPVHLNGRACDIDAIKKLAESVGAFVIEDTCKGLFSKSQNRHLGTIGDMGCFSLGMISPISIGYGGMVVTKDKFFYEKLKKIRDHGVERNPECYKYLGFNFKISDLLASLAIPQLAQVEQRKKRLVAAHNYYTAHLNHPDITILPVDTLSGGIPVYVEARSSRREEVIEFLESKQIQISRFHHSIDQASYLKSTGNYPHAKRLTEECFILPSGPAQPMENICRVVEELNTFATCGALH